MGNPGCTTIYGVKITDYRRDETEWKMENGLRDPTRTRGGMKKPRTRRKNLRVLSIGRQPSGRAGLWTRVCCKSTAWNFELNTNYAKAVAFLSLSVSLSSSFSFQLAGSRCLIHLSGERERTKRRCTIGQMNPGVS